MKRSNHFGFRNHATNSGTPEWLSIVHRVVCTICILLSALCLLRCFLSFMGAVHDARKFGGLGFSYTFFHYLSQNDFPQDAILCLGVLAELLHYRFHYRRVAEQNPLKYGNWCFIVLLLFHGAIWLHANFFVDSSASILAAYYWMYARISILPAAAYFLLYRLQLQVCW